MIRQNTLFTLVHPVSMSTDQVHALILGQSITGILAFRQ